MLRFLAQAQAVTSWALANPRCLLRLRCAVTALALVALLGLRSSLGDIEIRLESSTTESSILPRQCVS